MSRTTAAVGRRIRDARERKGLTQAELADLLGRTPTAISYWEGGHRSPSLDDVVRLATALGIAAADLLPSPSPRVLARSQAAQLARRDIATVVEPIIERFEQQQPLPEGPAISSTNPVEVAGMARRAAGQDEPWIDLAPILKMFGVRYLKVDMPEGLSGLVLYVNDTPIIAVRDEDSEKRRRFSAAHELGHVLLNHSDTFHVDLTQADGIPPNYDWRHERAANDFAAALLMPAALIRSDLENDIAPTPARLADRYKVSEQAMSIRLSVLGVPFFES